MIRRAAIWALEEAILAKRDELQAIAFAKKSDPILRWAVVRKVRLAIQQVLLNEPDCQTEALLRLAQLHIAKPKMVWHEKDILTLDKARQGEGPIKRPRRWFSAIALGLGVCGTLIAGFFVFKAVFADPEYDPSRSVPRSGIAAAYAEGGIPLRKSDACDFIFSKALPNYIVSLSRWNRAGASAALEAEILGPARAAVLNENNMKLLEPVVYEAISKLLDLAKEVVVAPESDLLPAYAAMEKQMQSTNAKLAETGLGYYVDGRASWSNGRVSVLLHTFFVELVRIYVTDSGHRERVLRLRRADSLNWDNRAIGFTREGAEEAVVVLGKVEKHLVSVVLPSLDPDFIVELLTGNKTRSRQVIDLIQQVEKQATSAVRSEFIALAKKSNRAEELGRLIARRHQIFYGWEKELAKSGMKLSLPMTYRVNMGRYATLESLVPSEEFTEFVQIDEQMGDPGFEFAFLPIYEQVISSIERHEIQHRLDYAARPRLPLPHGLERFVNLYREDGSETSKAQRIKFELSAMLAELARGETVLHTNITLYSRNLLSRSERGSPYYYGLIIIFDGLAQLLDEQTKPIRRGEYFTVDVLKRTEMFLTVEKKELIKAAHNLWRNLFGGGLPGMVVVK